MAACRRSQLESRMATKRSMAIAIKDDERWRVESDLSTLMEAEKIKADTKRFARVQALAKEKMMAVAKVASDDAD
jgi:aminoglycoside/choline kinase family phosphotransferase